MAAQTVRHRRQEIPMGSILPPPTRVENALVNQHSFMHQRISQALAVIRLAQRNFGGDYPRGDRAESGDVFNSLVFAARLLGECNDHLNCLSVEPSSHQGQLAGFMGEAASMLAMFDAIVWADAMELTFPDATTFAFLGAVESAILRSIESLDALLFGSPTAAGEQLQQAPTPSIERTLTSKPRHAAPHSHAVASAGPGTTASPSAATQPQNGQNSQR
jgi:hypothetical protein